MIAANGQFLHLSPGFVLDPSSKRVKLQEKWRPPMRKRFWVLCVTGLLLLGMGIAYAQPEPVRLVEMTKKPGVDFRQFTSVGTDVSVSIRPTSEWAIDKTDPFLKQRVQDLTLKAAKNQGWVTTSTDADVKLSVKILEWGRMRATNDQNLMEYVTVEFKADSAASGGLIFLGTGRYSRVDPVEPDLNKVNDAFVSIMEEMLAAMRVN
jgi:hypothetical protein